MRGAIRAKGKDSWQISFYTGRIVNGKRERYFETVHAHRKSDAQLVLNERLVNQEKNIALPKGRVTVSECLNIWMEGYVKTNCSPRTLDGYKLIADKHLVPALGHIKLRELQAPAIQDYYSEACEDLSARTVHHIHRVLSQALRYSVKHGMLGRNPCEDVDPPSPRKMPMRTLTPGEVEVLLATALGRIYYPIIYTAVSSGLRRAELLGLRWRDLDLDYCTISVAQVLAMRNGEYSFKEPKTEHSRRRVKMTPKLALFLKEYKAEKESKAGKPVALDSLVFTRNGGEPVNPSVLSHEFQDTVKKAGLGNCRFHDLRHTFASLCLLRGVSPKVISEALGHSSVAFTMDVYSHIIKGMQEDAMALLDEALPKGINFGINASLTPNPVIMSSNN